MEDGHAFPEIRGAGQVMTCTVRFNSIRPALCSSLKWWEIVDLERLIEQQARVKHLSTPALGSSISPDVLDSCHEHSIWKILSRCSLDSALKIRASASGFIVR